LVVREAIDDPGMAERRSQPSCSRRKATVRAYASSGRIGVELRAVRFDEPMVRARVDVGRTALAELRLQLGHLCGVVELVVLGEVALVCDPARRLEDAGVEADEGDDLGPGRGDLVPVPGAHAQADDRRAVAADVRMGEQMVARSLCAAHAAVLVQSAVVGIALPD